eukprot:354798-Chlamydomonas_euryale.AAC.2
MACGLLPAGIVAVTSAIRHAPCAMRCAPCAMRHAATQTTPPHPHPPTPAVSCPLPPPILSISPA